MGILKIALTGGVGCGKSQLGRFLAELGLDVIQLDDISKTVTTPESSGLKALVDAFGKKILTQDNSLNRKILREVLLQNKNNQTLIEEILHPKILALMGEEINKAKGRLVVVEVALLVEKNLSHLFDRVVVVTCDKELQRRRLQSREGVNEELAKRMIAAQIGHDDRLKVAKELPCDVIENNNTLADLEQKSRQLYQKLINL